MLNSGGSSERLCCSSCSLRLAFSCSRFWCACLSSFASLCLRTTLRASSKIHTSARCSGDIAAQTSNVPWRCSYTRFSVSCTNFSARWIASFPSLLGERGEGLASSTLVAVAVATQAAFQTLNSFAKYLCSASSCWWLGGLKDHDVGVQVWVDEKSVGGGSRHWSARAGKSRERGSKLKGIEVASISRLKAVSYITPGQRSQRRNLLGSSQRADDLAQGKLRCSCRVQGMLVPPPGLVLLLQRLSIRDDPLANRPRTLPRALPIVRLDTVRQRCCDAPALWEGPPACPLDNPTFLLGYRGLYRPGLGVVGCWALPRSSRRGPHRGGCVSWSE